MRETTRNVLVGATTILGLGALAGLLLMFGEFTDVLTARVPVRMHFNAAGGVREGSLVTLHGVPVGVVERVSVGSGDDARPVLVLTQIDREVALPDPCRPGVEASLLGSGARIELAPAGSERGTPKPLDPAAPPTLDGDAFSLEERLMTALDSRLGGLKGQFETVSADLHELSVTYTELGRNLNDLVKPVETGSPEAEGNLRLTVERLNRMLAGADEAFRLAQGWLGDDAMKGDVKTAVANAKDLIAAASAAVERYGQFAERLDGDREQLVARLGPTLDEARATLGEVRTAIALAHSGEGTVARLLRDDGLYRSLDDSAKRLSATLKQVEAVAERLKAEGIVIEFGK
jgi:phospholipid/cholesterol/gamma-HCH transport system substrate-binding protein